MMSEAAMTFMKMDPSQDWATEFALRDDVVPPGTLFLAAKQLFDIVVSLILLCVLIPIGVILICLNPVLNPGPLLFVQKRMGRNCAAFPAIKFRTMQPCDNGPRDLNAPIENARIPPLGRILRQLRIDELPQILNVLRGEMSLIGPRPDYFEHALQCMIEIPNYGRRHIVSPGITGLAQTELGYAIGIEATREKVKADLNYIETRGFRTEARIILRTFSVILSRSGK